MDFGVLEDGFVGEIIKGIVDRMKEEMDKNQMTIRQQGEEEKSGKE